MYDQIYNYFQNNELFYNSQYGFRKNHSTELATLEIIDRIIQEMDKYNTPINIYIDLSKAFDTIDHKILLCKLKYYGLNGAALDLCRNYLVNRKQYVERNSKYQIRRKCYYYWYSTRINFRTTLISNLYK